MTHNSKDHFGTEYTQALAAARSVDWGVPPERSARAAFIRMSYLEHINRHQGSDKTCGTEIGITEDSWSRLRPLYLQSERPWCNVQELRSHDLYFVAIAFCETLLGKLQHGDIHWNDVDAQPHFEDAFRLFSLALFSLAVNSNNSQDATILSQFLYCMLVVMQCVVNTGKYRDLCLNDDYITVLNATGLVLAPQGIDPSKSIQNGREVLSRILGVSI